LSPRRTTLLAVVLVGAGWALTLWVSPWSDERVNDLFVYRSYAQPVLAGALPYRDILSEYPPLASPAIVLPGLVGTGAETFRLVFAGWTLLLAVVVGLLCGALAARTGGDRRRAVFAVALMPLLCGALVRTHFDLAPVALTLAALLLLCMGRSRAGMAVLGLGAMTKFFPLLIAPVALAWLVGRGRRREAWQGAAALLAVLVVLGGAAVAASPQGALDAVRYHLDRPVQIESTPALALLALDEAGLGDAVSVASHRSDGLAHWGDGLVTGVFAAGLVGVIALLTLFAARRPDPRGLVLASLAAVTAFAVLGKVLSPQFVIWIVPLGALAFAWRMHALAAAVAAAAVLTQLEFPSRYFDLVAREPLPLALVALRNAALLVVVALAVGALTPTTARAGAAARSRSHGHRRPPRPAPRSATDPRSRSQSALG
jgi:Glycosyltransferase family 87